MPLERRVDAGSLSLGCLEYEPVHAVPSARPVMLFHGLTDSSWSLHPLAEALASEHRVFSFDLRGHGRSDWGSYTPAHFVGDVRGVIETLELAKPIVIGHSLGGQAASQFCGLYPEVPNALVLIEALGPPPNRRRLSDPLGHELDGQRRMVELVRHPARNRPQPSFEAAVERFQKAHPLLDLSHAKLVVEKGTRELADGSFEWRFDPETRDWLAAHDHERAEQRWRGVTCPTFVVQGADAWDRFWQHRIANSEELDGPMSESELQRRLDLFADVEHVVIEGAGHMVHYDRPTELIRAVGDFVKQVSSAE